MQWFKERLHERNRAYEPLEPVEDGTEEGFRCMPGLVPKNYGYVVPPPMEGLNTATNKDLEMPAGDRTKIEPFTWIWDYDIEDTAPSTLAHPGVPHQAPCIPISTGKCIPGDAGYIYPSHVWEHPECEKLDDYLRGNELTRLLQMEYPSRAAQIRSAEGIQATDTSFQFKRGFTSDSQGAADTGISFRRTLPRNR
ncbi:MAG: hypothetical protein SWE60_06130 [Thermodesulfobacteriota bacterium]|nr:hypothetical protein [Thermodesulfobacteriota bacterium]